MSVLAPLASLTTALLLASGAPLDFQSAPSISFAPPPHTVAVLADRDATLFEQTDGQLASGAGDGLFIGRTNQPTGALRRALLHFTPPDIPSSGQGRGVLENVVLVLHVSPTLPSQPDPMELRVHEVLADWGEGASVSPAGTGVFAEVGDATWVHTAFSIEPTEASYWLHNGGQFGGLPLASAARGPDDTWRFSSPALTALVARWIAEPDSNFGLIVLGNETTRQTAKTIASREHAQESVRPVLELTIRSGVRGLLPEAARPSRATRIGTR
jgi:hypothetical protein